MNIRVFAAKKPDTTIPWESYENIFEVLSQSNEVLREVLEQREGWYRNLRYGLLKKLEFFVKKWYSSLPETYMVALQNNAEILDYIWEVALKVRSLGDDSIDEYPLW